MKANRTEVIDALAHAVRGGWRAAAAGRSKALPGGPIDETRRRTMLLRELYRRYSAETAGEDGVLVYRDMLPPDGWINDCLRDRHEAWRVHNVDGFRCEIFTVDA